MLWSTSRARRSSTRARRWHDGVSLRNLRSRKRNTASLPRSDLRPKESASSFGTATTDRSTLSQYTRALEHDVVWHNATATMTRSLQHRSWPKSVQGVDEESWWPVPFRRLLGHEGVIWLPPLRPSFQLPFARAGFIRFWKRFGPRPLAALVRRVAIGY